jgi:poly(A) polymerase Pap1
MHSLLKLNPLRDMHYLQRTIPDLASFRLAYRFIKTWAVRRGIYSSKLGYLGGIHITLFLSRVAKLAFQGGRVVSAPELIVTFFKTYAKLDWACEMVFDPGFYVAKPRYFRSAREPAVILTLHTPKVNVARSATVPSVRILEAEFKRMDGLLSDPEMFKNGQTTWSDVLGSAQAGVENFLTSYPSYVKVNVQHWGAGGAKGRMLVGWLEWRCVSLLIGMLSAILVTFYLRHKAANTATRYSPQIPRHPRAHLASTVYGYGSARQRDL